MADIVKKQILIGADSFEKVAGGDYFYIDKTMFVKELLENRGEVTLITRPRRFGKTLNMNMLKSFFDISKDNRRLFEGLRIMEHEDITEQHMGKYPVVSLTLKNVEERTFDQFVNSIRSLVSSVYSQNLYLYESDKLNERQKKDFYMYYDKAASNEELKSALLFLTVCLHAYYDKNVIVLLDEYDAPINNALIKGYYQEMIEFMRGFLGGVFKSNDCLEFGVLTGVQRISKEGLVSGFNNPLVCGIADEEFSDCYGFTEEEVIGACEAFGHGDRFCDVKKWYDGYRFGNRDMYNPWSIVQFLRRGVLANYWANTGGMDILQDIFFKGSAALKDDMAGLLTGNPIRMMYDEHITYPIPYESDDAFWSMLLNAGYLKPCAGSVEEPFYAELVNREVKDTFARCIELWFKRQQREILGTIQSFVERLLNGDANGVSRALCDELLNNPSYYDLKDENSYHLFIFGILLAVSRNFVVLSNQESGKGRSDCIIKPDDKSEHAVIIEFKHIKELPAESSKGSPADDNTLAPEYLIGQAREGLKQIDEKAYVHNLRNEGYSRIYKYAIAFHKKSCEVAMETEQ